MIIMILQIWKGGGKGSIKISNDVWRHFWTTPKASSGRAVKICGEGKKLQIYITLTCVCVCDALCDASLDCDGLGQVSWAVDVAASEDGEVVGKHLHGDHGEDRLEGVDSVRNLNDLRNTNKRNSLNSDSRKSYVNQCRFFKEILILGTGPD